MPKKCFVSLALAALCAPAVHAQFADAVVSYVPGSGFASGFTTPSTALGAPTASGSVTPFAPPFSNTQLVSVGAGGSLTLQFNTPIFDDPVHPFGLDFEVFGNSFFVTSGGNATGGLFTSSGSTRVEVSPDNLNWYTLNPAIAPAVGTLFPTDGPGNPVLPVNPLLTAGDFAGKNLAGIRALYNGSAGGAGFDLAWAQDGFGNSVVLPFVSYVRIDVLTGRTQIDAVSVVPEPASMAFIALALGLGTLRFMTFKAKTKNQTNS